MLYKKQLLIVAHHLTIGGAQKSLLAALKVIDYSKYDVTLYLRKNRTDLLQLVDDRVNVIINKDTKSYYKKPLAVWYQMCIALSSIFNKKELSEKLDQKLSMLINRYSMEYERKQFFNNKSYDIAIAYVHGYDALFVADYVEAVRKLVFYHTSVDELHFIHENIFDKFNCIVAINNEQKELLSTWYPKIRDKLTVVENYCDKALLCEQSMAYNVPKQEGKLVLCSCGRLSSVKGFDLAVEAARLIKENNLSFVWYFVGDGPEREKIEKLIKKYGLSEEIVITGMQKNPYPYMAACDIYVQPSYQEALPMTLIEAKRLCKPMITTDTVGGRKLVADNFSGIICDINSDSLAFAVKRLAEDKTLYDELKNNLNNVDYSGEEITYRNQWLKLLGE